MVHVTELQSIAGHFLPYEMIHSVSPIGDGLINDTFLLTPRYPKIGRIVLQRINAKVFPDPPSIMANLRIVLDHFQRSAACKLQMPTICSTLSGEDYWRADDGDFWRAITYIEATRTLPHLTTLAEAEQIGYVLGHFHARLSELDPTWLRDTLPGFHIAPQYLARFDEIASLLDKGTITSRLRHALDFVEARRSCIDVLERAKEQGLLPIRIIHGDPKLNNILFAETSGKAVSLIDLDTVKPGLILYDVGDCLRSCCKRFDEIGTSVEFDLNLCRAILQAYLLEAQCFITEAEGVLIYDAIRLLPLELGVRFLTDHLAGDIYFKVAKPGQNLQRALAQFQLVDSVERQERQIRTLLAKWPK